jgi:hypothetical protein
MVSDSFGIARDIPLCTDYLITVNWEVVPVNPEFISKYEWIVNWELKIEGLHSQTSALVEISKTKHRTFSNVHTDDAVENLLRGIVHRIFAAKDYGCWGLMIQNLLMSGAIPPVMDKPKRDWDSEIRNKYIRKVILYGYDGPLEWWVD